MFKPFEKLVVTLASAAALAVTGCGHSLPGATARLAGLAGAASVKAGFMWGVSTAGYQWEGYDTSSNWAAWDAAGKTSERNVKGADGMHDYAADAQLTQGLGCNTFRTSIEWARIEPTEGSIDPQAVAYYHDLLRQLHAHGLTPVITLHHFTHPQWIAAQGGWENPETAQKFAKFCGFVAKEFGNDIDTYLTFNEPNVFVAGGYLAGQMPPGKHNPVAALNAINNMVKGHKLAYAAIHANDSTARVSFNWYTAEWALNASKAQTEAEQKVGSDTWMLDQAVATTKEGGRTLDYVSFDYYTKLTASNLTSGLPRQDQWVVYPEGMYNALKRFHKRYNLPILIAENGMATWEHTNRADRWTRAAYIVAHVQQMQRAINEGVPVLGYIQWSITDNYEWGSYSPCFGLYRVDCRQGDFTRVPTDGVDAFKAVIANGGVNAQIAQRYLPGTGGTVIPLPAPEANGGSQVAAF